MCQGKVKFFDEKKKFLRRKQPRIYLYLSWIIKSVNQKPSSPLPFYLFFFGGGDRTRVIKKCTSQFKLLEFICTYPNQLKSANKENQRPTWHVFGSDLQTLGLIVYKKTLVVTFLSCYLLPLPFHLWKRNWIDSQNLTPTLPIWRHQNSKS